MTPQPAPARSPRGVALVARLENVVRVAEVEILTVIGRFKAEYAAGPVAPETDEALRFWSEQLHLALVDLSAVKGGVVKGTDR